MLSIAGQTFAEVFSNLAADERLDEAERAAAGEIGSWFWSYEDARARMSRAAMKGDEAAYNRASDEKDRLAVSHPFIGTNPAPGAVVQEWRTFIHGDVKFTIFPHTTGGTMNVGVDRIRKS